MGRICWVYLGFLVSLCTQTRETVRCLKSIPDFVVDACDPSLINGRLAGSCVSAAYLSGFPTFVAEKIACVTVVIYRHSSVAVVRAAVLICTI